MVEASSRGCPTDEKPAYRRADLDPRRRRGTRGRRILTDEEHAGNFVSRSVHHQRRESPRYQRKPMKSRLGSDPESRFPAFPGPHILILPPKGSARFGSRPASRRDLVRVRRDHAATPRPQRASPRPRRRGPDVPLNIEYWFTPKRRRPHRGAGRGEGADPHHRSRRPAASPVIRNQTWRPSGSSSAPNQKLPFGSRVGRAGASMSLRRPASPRAALR